MLADARLHHKFWQDAVATANYIYNRLPHKGINNKVPYEVLFKNTKLIIIILKFLVAKFTSMFPKS